MMDLVKPGTNAEFLVDGILISCEVVKIHPTCIEYSTNESDDQICFMSIDAISAVAISTDKALALEED